MAAQIRKVRVRALTYINRNGMGVAAYRGDELDSGDMADGQLERLEGLDAFEPVKGKGKASKPAFDAASATDEELVEWIGKAKPKAIIDAAGDDVALAERLLTAESLAKPGDERETVTGPLGAIVNG